MRGVCAKEKVSPKFRLHKVICAKYAGTKKLRAAAVKLLFVKNYAEHKGSFYLYAPQRPGSAWTLRCARDNVAML